MDDRASLGSYPTPGPLPVAPSTVPVPGGYARRSLVARAERSARMHVAAASRACDTDKAADKAAETFAGHQQAGTSLHTSWEEVISAARTRRAEVAASAEQLLSSRAGTAGGPQLSTNVGASATSSTSALADTHLVIKAREQHHALGSGRDSQASSAQALQPKECSTPAESQSATKRPVATGASLRAPIASDQLAQVKDHAAAHAPPQQGNHSVSTSNDWATQDHSRFTTDYEHPACMKTEAKWKGTLGPRAAAGNSAGSMQTPLMRRLRLGSPAQKGKWGSREAVRCCDVVAGCSATLCLQYLCIHVFAKLAVYLSLSRLGMCCCANNLTE